MSSQATDLYSVYAKSSSSSVSSQIDVLTLFFNQQVKEINVVLARRVREEVMKVLDQRENEYLPQVILDKIEVSLALRIYIPETLARLLNPSIPYHSLS